MRRRTFLIGSLGSGWLAAQQQVQPLGALAYAQAEGLWLAAAAGGDRVSALLTFRPLGPVHQQRGRSRGPAVNMTNGAFSGDLPTRMISSR